MKSGSVFAAVGLGLAIAVPAWADPRDDARRHFAEGLQAVGAGQYDVAILRFLAAQEAFPHPMTLYNIGRAYADSGDLPNAIVYFRRFREADPTRAAFIDPIIADLEARSGPVNTVVASGPAPANAIATGEEAARFDAIVSELRALTDALDARSKELVPSAQPIVTSPVDTPPVAGISTELDPGFSEDAYRRIVVTASRVGQEPLDSPSTITIITAEDIRLSGALDIPDLLRRVAGVETMAPSAGHSDVAIRGLQRKMNNTVLFLVDGRSVYQDSTGWMFWGPVTLQLEEIDRIEVIRGPGAAVYGANAVTGVVNIITRAPGEGQSELSVTGGTLGVRRFSGVATGRVGESAYRLSAGYQQQGVWSKDADIRPGGDSAVFALGDDDDIALEAVRINARADRALGDWGAFSLSAGLSESSEEYISLGSLKNQIADISSQYVRGDLFVGDFHVRSFWTNSVGYVGNVVQYQGERTLDAPDDTDVVDVEVEIPKTIVTGPVNHQFNIGGGWRYKGLRGGYLDGGFDKRYEENHFSAFANEQATVGKLSVVASLRVDVHPLIDIEKTTSPRAAVLWRLFEKTSLRLTAGTAFRVPSPGESYFGLGIPTASNGVYVNGVPNRDLLPERIVTYELGVHDESTFFHQADVVVYYNHLTNLIYTADVAPTIDAYDPVAEGFSVGNNGFENLDSVYDAVGVEGDLELYPTDGLDLFVNGTLSRVLETTGAGVRAPDRTASEVKLNVGGSYRSPYRTDLSLWVNWLSPQEWPIRVVDPATLSIVVQKQALPARAVVAARIAARPFEEESFELALTGWNLTELFGEGFREHPQGQLTQARVYGTASWRF